ncbi:hypothetical protein PG996_005359 [Apiospora saccharicola]|uniref:F-box domain-containing protein n=1 Tax=Apiospora saccharicola TaxID=335842 RepID=A0ABR1VL90_9PEZI
MSLGSLPPELVLHIVSFLEESDRNSLLQSCKDLTRLLEQQLYSDDRNGARKALKWGLDKGFVGTVIKAQQVGYDIHQTWYRVPEPSASNDASLQNWLTTRPRYLVFMGDHKKDWLLRTALVRAIRNGHQAVARYMLDEGVKLRGLTIYKTNYGNAYLQPIHHIILAAAEAKMQDLLLHVLQQGVRSNTPGMLDGRLCRVLTPLGLSLQSECPAEITEILLNYGADPTAPTGFWIWPEIPLCQPFQQVWQQLLLAEGSDWMAGVECAKKVCLLLNRVPNLNSVSFKKEPLLPLLCSHITPQRLEFLTIIVSRGHGLDPNFRSPLSRLLSNMLETDMGYTLQDSTKRAVYVLAAEGMLQTLLRMGANPNLPPDLPPLHQICFSRDDGPHWDRIFETLVGYGAWLGDASTPGRWARTPLHCVCLKSGPINLKRLVRLLELGSPVNALNNVGDTALSMLHRRHAAEPLPSMEAGMEILIKHGAVCTRDLPRYPYVADMFRVGEASML